MLLFDARQIFFLKNYRIQDMTKLLFTPVSITTLIGTEDARFILNGISPIAKGDLKWRDALLVTGTVNSNKKDGYRIKKE